MSGLKIFDAAETAPYTGSAPLGPPAPPAPAGTSAVGCACAPGGTGATAGAAPAGAAVPWTPASLASSAAIRASNSLLSCAISRAAPARLPDPARWLGPCGRWHDQNTAAHDQRRPANGTLALVPPVPSPQGESRSHRGTEHCASVRREFPNGLTERSVGDQTSGGGRRPVEDRRGWCSGGR